MLVWGLGIPSPWNICANHAGDDHFDASDYHSRHPDGRIGSDPSPANPEDGQRLLETAAAELLEDYQVFLEE